ncbi:hypothetical protein IKG20_02955 [Candidatus Saccharibacteria bacterium]|nr:hypothetical protein [Candidatus Saccharibacteria bacterium]
MEEKSSNLSQTDTALPSSDNKVEKQKNPFKIATVICAILALAGIGFGVYELLQKPQTAPQGTNTSELESELSSLKQKYTVLQNYVKDLEASGTEIPEDAKSATDGSSSASFHNAVIASSNDDGRLDLYFESDDYYNKKRSINITIHDGAIEDCTLREPSSDGYGKTNAGDCEITGVSGKISAISQIGNTQMSWPYLGFLMEDGSVEYISAFELTENFSTSVKGKLKLDSSKPVTNIVNNIGVGNTEGPGGYRTTAFYHNDGSISYFNDSMVSE